MCALELLAADWGMTHLYMDYWGQGWRGEGGEPREATVLKATEHVHALGYRLFMGLYQDGENFAMREFWRNVSEQRDTVYWMRQYARSPVWTWLGGKPFQAGLLAQWHTAAHGRPPGVSAMAPGAIPHGGTS